MAFGIFASLTGNEVLQVTGIQANGMPSGQSGQCTTGQIAALASTESAPFVVTPITTAGNGTLTAAGLVGGEIVRTGPVAAFSDATDTAAAIIAALPGTVVGSSFNILLKNATAFTQTITAGSGVTLPATVIVPAFSVANYIGTVSTGTTVTLVHVDTTPISIGANTTAPAITTLSTVGAGTLLAAEFVGGLINRAGSQSGTAFTDTTDTAAAIIAACANLVNKIGTSMLVEYSNSTNAIATVTGGMGVTVSGVAIIPANTIAQFLITYTAAATLTMVGLGITQNTASSLTMLGSSSGQTILAPTAAAGTDAGNTLTLPAITGTLASTSGANLFIADISKSSATVNPATTGLITVTGLSGQTLVAGATYRFRAVLPGLADGTSGQKYAFTYTTATLTSIEATGIGYTVSAVAVQHTTTTTNSTLLFDQAAALVMVILEGTMVVNAGGTVALQTGTHTGTTAGATYVGATMEFVRIA